MKGVWWLALAASAAAALPKKQEHNLMKLPSFRGVAEVRSSLPGRMRLYLPAVQQQPETAQQMAAQLEGTGVIHQVTVQPVTGSVLVQYDETRVQASVVFGAVLKLMGLDEKIKAAPVSKIRQGIGLLLRSIDQAVLNATGDLLDAPTLAAGVLTVAALRSKKQEGWAAPGAMTLLWWASKLFGAPSHE